MLHGNPDYENLTVIQMALQGNVVPLEFEEYHIEDLSSYRFATIVSVDVERSFWAYKALLSDRR